MGVFCYNIDRDIAPVAQLDRALGFGPRGFAGSNPAGCTEVIWLGSSVG